MTREEAIRIAESDTEFIVKVLLEMSARIEELERKVAQLTKDSSNSSRPPSSDGPAKKPRPRPPIKSRKRRPGGQPGHKGNARTLLPAEDMDDIIKVFPETCEGCNGSISANAPGCQVVGEPERRQVTDIPPIELTHIEYRLHSLKCSCGKITRPPIPPAAKYAFGPRIQAIAAYLTACHRVSRRGLQEIFATLFGVSISLGSVCNHLKEMSKALEICCEELRTSLPKQPVLNIDESGWKTKAVARWLWVFVTPLVAYFHVAQSRSSQVLKDILGQSYSGVLCSDMYSAYKAFHKWLSQYCWAHRIRDLRGVKHSCSSPDAVQFAKWMTAEIGRMFGVWHAFKQDLIDRQTLVRKTVPIRARMANCLQKYALSKDYDVSKTAKTLLKHWDGLFTFLEHPGVEPTNNSAEQALRPGVLWRKNCFGTQCPDGEILVSRLLTATRTCRLQNRNRLEFLADSIIAFRSGTTPPSLLPQVTP